jgi:hypothetical protein
MGLQSIPCVCALYGKFFHDILVRGALISYISFTHFSLIVFYFLSVFSSLSLEVLVEYFVLFRETNSNHNRHRNRQPQLVLNVITTASFEFHSIIELRGLMGHITGFQFCLGIGIILHQHRLPVGISWVFTMRIGQQECNG